MTTLSMLLKNSINEQLRRTCPVGYFSLTLLNWDFQMRIFNFVNFEMVGKIGYWDRFELVLLYSVIKKN